jgi:hypothetical protein
MKEGSQDKGRGRVIIRSIYLKLEECVQVRLIQTFSISSDRQET